ncbi:MAG TPA: phenylalanine--tRNA ligase subunit beta [Candidatus Tumulicola sp.]|nr:phenylalanine--tRNA ligase subunit beta [Candidatus Tumulicola sp.]
MRAPISWLKDFVAADVPAQTIAEVLTARGLTVDDIVPQPTPQHIVVGRIEKLERHPNADRLLVGSVDVGREKLQIVTGAANVAAGNKVPIALVGASVFEHGSSDAAAGHGRIKTILKSALRGVESNGMMCSATELALPGEFDDGILIMEDSAPVGEDFWRVARFGDALLDVDVPANRPDCLSIIGLARELAAGLKVAWREPDYPPGIGEAPSPLGVEIADPSVCRRLLGQTFTGLRGGRSPMWMTLRLHAAGVRSLNYLVDVSNFVQIETAQPLHFYDAKLVRGKGIVARAARAGEKVVTLDGVERELLEGTPVIADGEGVVGVAGIFGGVRSAVTEKTTDLFLESPNFVGARIRRASLALGLRTEGAARHEKNLPLELPELGRRAAARLLMQAGGRPSAVVDVGEKPGAPRTISARPARVNALLGSDYTAQQMSAAIAPIGLRSSGGASLKVEIPWWRIDLADETDVVEEVARALGYDGIKERPSVASPQTIDESLFDQESALAQTLATLGYHEVVTLALQGTRVIADWERSGLPFWPKLVGITNPLSDEQRFVRPSLLPGVLTIAARWWKKTPAPLRLFETGHIFRPLDSEKAKCSAGALAPGTAPDGAYSENGVFEWPSLCGVAAFAELEADAAIDRHLLAVKGEVESVITTLAGTPGETTQHPRFYFHPGAAGNVTLEGKVVAKFGRLHPRLARAYELPEASYAFVLYLENLPKTRPVLPLKALPRFPGTKRDLAVVVAENVSAADLMQAARGAGVATFESVSSFDEYRGPQIGAGKKSVALTVSLRKADGTITDAEADAGLRVIIEALREKFGAHLRE